MPPDYPPDLLERTCHTAQVPASGGPPEHLTVFIHYNGVLEALDAEYPGWPLPFSTPSPPVYKIIPIEGAGLSMVATVDIAAGEVIVRERPLLLAPRAFSAPKSGEHATNIIVRAAQSLHPENKRIFYALKNVKGNTVPSAEEGLINTNAFACGPFPAYNGRYGGVARDASRANHSCSPNATHSFDAATLTQSLRAFRAIRAGEEITVSYVCQSMTAKARQEELLRRYFFTCVCQSCRLTGSARDSSDMFRAMICVNAVPDLIVGVDAAFETWLADPARVRPANEIPPASAPLDPASFTLMLWNEMEEEEFYDPALSEPVLTRLVKAYSVFEDEERVRHYATRAAELRMLHADWDEDGGWRAVAQNPRMTVWWGKLKA
ncbi:SET domain-containing protein [Polyporus arcularius HHB13444]|uniref:SET domain-containing protein n=1 Tax=Polyporus arcularius HHB13444 TaxID=1314778 RepID=A0A5C3PIY3_9APHY|nr:SET domain-containing protein [Polyporus arcularius HHB13444]